MGTDEALALVAAALKVVPQRALRQPLSNSGKAIYQVFLPGGECVALRTSVRPKTFAYTQHNLNVLRALGLPVPSVLASGLTPSGGSFIILSWIPGQDLVQELPAMSGAQMTRLAEQVVQLQRRVAQLPRAQKFGPAPIGRSGSLNTWTETFGNAPTVPPHDDGTILGSLRARLCRCRAQLEPYFRTVQPLCFLDDLNTKNILVENGVLRGLIDLDFVCYGDPLLAIGTTLACIVADMQGVGAFYGEELVRLWNPDADERRAIFFYAALWAVGCLSLNDADAQPQRHASLSRAADSWLCLCQPHSAMALPIPA
jgi:aminoglycoside phosphotransferase (APT) family kinase protein